ncbi:MAG: branched-chain amino acid aminotransferase [Bacteroidota bacterium]
MTNLASSFGANPAPQMFVAKYADDQWDSGKIQAFSDLVLSPFAMCFHYGQTVFEGLKVFRTADNQVTIFREKDNYLRINKSLERMAMPTIPSYLWENGVVELTHKVKDYVPAFREGTLYLRPFVIATQPKLGVEISNEYLFIVAACPVSSYYSKPLRVKVEKHFTRAAPGGAGYAKCGGNYGSAYYPFKRAKEAGFDQILWTDACKHEFFEESGTMNYGFIIDNTFITSPASDTVLDGITRKSVMQLAKDLQMQVEERPFSVTELRTAFSENKKVEAFGLGTAAVLAPFESISIDDVNFPCYHAQDATMLKLKKLLLAIQIGEREDKYHWNTLVSFSHLHSERQKNNTSTSIGF